MIINGINKVTLLDYPQYVACIIFTQGCPFKCPFCQNSPLLGITNDEGIISEEDVLSYLRSRKNILDGLVISGGEPTIQKDLKQFIIKVKELGLKVKLDTNGFNPEVVKDLLNNNLLDYVAVDIKNDLDNYAKSCGFKSLDISNLLKTIKILKNSKIDYEFRTTIMKKYHSISEITNILDLIGPNVKYYLQNFRDSENVIDHTIEGFSEKELIDIEKELQKKYPNVKVRGL